MPLIFYSVAALVAYLLGSIPFGYLLVRFFRKEDIRQKGSGNIGATNVMRSGSKGLGAVTFLLDVLKGFFAVWLCGMVAARIWPDAGNPHQRNRHRCTLRGSRTHLHRLARL